MAYPGVPLPPYAIQPMGCMVPPQGVLPQQPLPVQPRQQPLTAQGISEDVKYVPPPVTYVAHSPAVPEKPVLPFGGPREPDQSFSSDSESDSDEMEEETVHLIAESIQKPSERSVTNQDLDDDLAYAIQLEGVLEEENVVENPTKKLKSEVSPQMFSFPKGEYLSNEEYLSKEDIVQLYKNGEPVDSMVNFFVALHPQEAQELEVLLSQEISAQSILSNVQQYFQQPPPPPVPFSMDDFTVDYLTPESDEEGGEFFYDDE